MSETTSASSIGMRLEAATERISAFSELGPAHHYFAQHAAFPMSLTVDLLYRLWANFQRDVHDEKLHIPWIAVADLLFSSLCDEVSHELYEIDVTVRAELLNGLQADPRFGQQRMHELSYFLLDYVQQQVHSSNAGVRKFAEAQQWTVLAYIQPGRAARELAEALKALEQNNKVEQIRLVSLMETLNKLAPPLSNLEGFTPLLTYARGVERVARGDIEGAKDHFSTMKEVEQAVGVQLPLPAGLGEERQKGAPPQQAPVTLAAPGTIATRKDFLISYHSADLDWANWIAWQLEEAGYTIELQAWAFQLGTNFVEEVDSVEKLAKHIIVILSPDYLSVLASLPAWVDAFFRDTGNGPDFMVAFHVRECRARLTRILGLVSYTNFVGLDEEAAHEHLLARVSNLPDATSVPSFSSSVIYHSLSAQPHFPGSPIAATKTDKAVEVFYSYSHRDEGFREELNEHLSILRRQGLIVTWHYGMIAAGTEWRPEIDMHLNTAQIILLLLSPDFLASDYAYRVEMKRALERHEAGEALVIPILLSPCLWNVTPLAGLRMLPTNGKAITDWMNREEAFADVADGIRLAIEQFANRSSTETEAPKKTEEGDAQANKRIAGANLLWVDDRPENNLSERRAMEAVGIQITLSQSTEDALEKVHSHTYDIIISDMGRQPPSSQALYDDRAGYNLLDRLRNQRIFTPFIIYAGSSSAEDQAETRSHGGFGTTNNPEVLFHMVIDAIDQSINRFSVEAGVPRKTEVQWIEEGMAHTIAGRYQEALEAYNQALGMDADYADGYKDRKTVYLAADVYDSRGFVYLRLGQYQQAIADYDHAIELGADYAASYSNRGFAYFQLTDYQRAIADYAHAIALKRDDIVTYIRWGDALYSLRNYAEAMDKYEQAIRLDPNNAYSYLGKGNNLYLLKRHEEALVAYNRAIELDKDFALAYFNRGAVYYELRNYELAISSYEAALRFYTQNAFPAEWANVQARLGVAYYMWAEGNRQDNLERAIVCYQRALKIYTRDTFPSQWSTLQQSLGDTFAAYSELPDVDKLDNLEKAVSYYKQVSPFESYIDVSEVAVENVHQEALVAQLAQEVTKLPKKQRTAMLIDLAKRVDSGELLIGLQEAFLDEGIQLKDYDQPLPEDRQERVRHAALLSVAYKRLRASLISQEDIS